MRGYTDKGAVWQLRVNGDASDGGEARDGGEAGGRRQADGDTIIADLIVDDHDWPWVYAKVKPHSGFDDVRPLFERELALLDDIENNVDEWEAAYGKIWSSLTLLFPDGAEVPEYILHVKDDNVWWRWNDHPFEA